ncbi:unnamed protein product [Paramecium sonneborni]|uniref:Uncharacterized protein n=1 Tax=Paramecium sonneborni TaxID=65129 RepID=A0A8S1QA14_9CILI|nr:unnamed protein product [Paramecium sonneborni]
MLFNNPNFQEVNQTSDSLPRPSIQDIVDKYSFRQSEKKQDDKERITFGQSYKIQRKTENEKDEKLVLNEQNLSNVLSDFSIISDDPSVFIGITNLKDKVLNLIQNNRESISQNDKKIQEEVSQIALEYSMYSQIGKSKHEPELQQMCALVEDFLYQFKKSKNLELSVIHNFQSDDSFYQIKDNNIEKLNNKLNTLKDALSYQLTVLKLPETKQILQKTIDNLNEIINANDIATIKTVIFKIEQKIEQIKVNEYALIELYDYINKAVKVSRSKLTDQDRLQISKIYQAIQKLNYQNSYQQALVLYEQYQKLPTKPHIDYYINRIQQQLQ